MRTIGVVTVGRSDFGIYSPILRRIVADPQLNLHLIVTGAHLSATYGWTIQEIIDQGFTIGDRVEMLLGGDSPEAIAKSMGLGTISLAQVYARVRPDLLMVLGDRFEMHAATVASVPFRLPVAHVHGGEVTHGAIDDCFRHAITKYSHLHFASTQEHGRRIVQLGEEPWRVTISGAPALDHLSTLQLLSRKELEVKIGMSLEVAPILVTFHPVTLQYEDTAQQIDELTAALSLIDSPIIITKPNADTSNHTIIRAWERFAQPRANVRLLDNLGIKAYFSLMSRAAAMVGNSSSGIIEAASFKLPVVNIGKRQSGRPRSPNVLDTGHHSGEIEAAVRRAVSDDFRASLEGLENIYGQGRAAEAIVKRLKEVTLDERLLMKQFHDWRPDNSNEPFARAA